MEEAFGTRLRDLRRAKNISQRELADRVGVDFSYISKLENNRLPPPAADTVEKICAALGVSGDELLALAGKVPSDVAEIIASSPAAQHFMQNLRAMSLSEDEWHQLTRRVKELKGR